MPEIGTLRQAIERAGLALRGVAQLQPAERVDQLAEARCVALVGMVGAEHWSNFETSPEADDGARHPLDRWSRRVVAALARDLDAAPLYPFDGPPYWPFQTWARRAEPVWPSPIGMLIHREYGLWHSYRGALAFRGDIEAPASAPGPSPCETCAGRPCLSACPVGAFSASGYDVDRCAAHLREAAGRECLDGGCLARRACPIGAAHGHDEKQARFHMRAFLAAR